MIISIASGKGGTGKTTIATNLAVSIADENEKIQFLDCDVEAPNAHLFLKPDIYETEKVGTPVPQVNLDKCDFCGKCDEICQFSAIAVVSKAILTFPELCHSCKGCMMICPQGAITESTREIGVLEKGKAGKVEFVSGTLRIGEAMSPPLIKEVKKTIKPHHVSIIDAPPGTSCPVVTALKGSDFSILVTEPTPFGLNDLILAVEVVKILGIPFGIVINRSDVGDNRIVEYANREGIAILLEISDQQEVAEAYSRGVMMTEAFPAWKEKFRELYQKIRIILQTP
jgi:MinD superfamily P-loop ATPase